MLRGAHVFSDTKDYGRDFLEMPNAGLQYCGFDEPGYVDKLLEEEEKEDKTVTDHSMEEEAPEEEEEKVKKEKKLKLKKKKIYKK